MRVVLLAAAAAAQTALDDTTIRTAVRLWLGNATARAEAAAVASLASRNCCAETLASHCSL